MEKALLSSAPATPSKGGAWQHIVAAVAAVALVLAGIGIMAAAPQRAWAAGSAYLVSLTDGRGNSLLDGTPIDPDALYENLCWQFQVPADYATDPNAIVSGFRLMVYDSAGNDVFGGVRALGYLDPDRMNSNCVDKIRLLPGETYTFSFAWITCTHLNGVGAEGTNGEVVVARESFTVSTAGAPQGDGDVGESGEEATPPAGSGEAADGPASSDEPTGSTAPDDAAPDAEEPEPAEPAAGTDAPADESADVGAANDQAVVDAMDDAFYGAPSQDGSVRPTEAAAAATSRAVAADALQAAARAAGASADDVLARTGGSPGEAGLSAEKLMGLGSVHKLQAGTLADDVAAASEGDTPFEMTTALVLRWVLLVAAVLGAAPAGAATRFLGMKWGAAARPRFVLASV